jgi:hypothetical protein
MSLALFILASDRSLLISFSLPELWRKDEK